MNISKVQVRHRILLQGKHNRAVFVCRECRNDMLNTLLSNVKGFAGVNNYTLTVVECDKCGDTYTYHADETTYAQFLDWVSFGWSRFYDEQGNRKILI